VITRSIPTTMTKQNTETSPEAQPHSMTATHGNGKKNLHFWFGKVSWTGKNMCMIVRTYYEF
jgi:hypothetical protein